MQLVQLAVAGVVAVVAVAVAYAGASHGVVGVESYAAGGSWHSAEDAKVCREELAQEGGKARGSWADGAASTAPAGHPWPTGLARSLAGAAQMLPAIEAGGKQDGMALRSVVVATWVVDSEGLD